MLRILVGHPDTDLPPYDRSRFDVQCIRGIGAENRPPSTISEMLEACQKGWRPDVYYHAGLVHFPLPEDIEAFPGLTATNIQDWHRGGRGVWSGAPFFDLIATERNACALLAKMGFTNSRFARFWGVNPSVHRVIPGISRDIDVLFIGSLNSDIWSERNVWIDRLARLADRFHVVVASGHFGEDYVRLTNRARIVFNRSVNGCTNQRAYDGPACGALVFNEYENDEVRESFVDGTHCIYYDAANFEDKVAYYLSHEAERSQIAEQGRLHVLANHTEEAHLNALFSLIETNRALQGTRACSELSDTTIAYRKAHQIYCCALPAAVNSGLRMIDASAAGGLDAQIAAEARAALQGWAARFLDGAARIRLLGAAIDHARLAAQLKPENVISQVALAFLLLERSEATGGAMPATRNDISDAVVALAVAAELCETALVESDSRDDGELKGFCYPRWNDRFDARIESAALLQGVDATEWARSMRKIIAWRCRCMLRDLAAANEQVEETAKQAVSAVNDLPDDAETLLYLARFAAVNGDLEHAATYYRIGLSNAPLHHEAWPEFATVLVALGLHDEARQFVNERLAVTAAIPALVGLRPALLEAIKSAT